MHFYSEVSSPLERTPLNFISSPIGILQVFSYTPTEGEQGVPITVNVGLQYTGVGAVHVRLFVGRKPIPTIVRELPDSSYGAWHLEGVVPAFDTQQPKSLTVPVAVQALNSESAILDTVTFGEFKYWESGERNRHYRT